MARILLKPRINSKQFSGKPLAFVRALTFVSTSTLFPACSGVRISTELQHRQSSTALFPIARWTCLFLSRALLR